MNSLLGLQFKACLAIPRQLKLSRVATTATLQAIRKISFRRKKSESAAIDVKPIKSDYEIELEKVMKKENYQEKFGFEDDDPHMDKLTAHMVMFLGISISAIVTPVLVFIYGPDHRSRMIEWRRYEAVELMEAREARGELPLNQDFAPPEMIESMVSPPGDWEEEWLTNQASVRTKAKRYYWVEAEHW